MPVARSAQHVIEVLTVPDPGQVEVSQDVVEVLMELFTASPTTITGGGVSQDVVEVLHQVTAPDSRVSQHVIEVLLTPRGQGPGEPGGGDPGEGGQVTRVSVYGG